MQFIFLTVRLFYNLTGRKGKESLQKLSILSVLHAGASISGGVGGVLTPPKICIGEVQRVKDPPI